MELVNLSSEEADALDRLAASWRAYVPALREKLSINGNVYFKLTRGVDVLVRVQRNASNINVSKTLGPRSPETENIYREFRARREDAILAEAEAEQRMALAGRLAHAHKLARIPANQAVFLRAIADHPVSKKLVLISGASLFAYEQGYQVRIPDELGKDPELTFLKVPGGQLDLKDVREIYKAAVGTARAPFEHADGRSQLRSTKGPVVNFIYNRKLLDHLVANHPKEAFAEDGSLLYLGITAAKDSRPVEIRTLIPSVHAFVCTAMADDIWKERASYLAALSNSPSETNVKQ